jgi:hypothetical protein
MEFQCKDDEMNPYNPDDDNWTPTNLQLRYCIEDLMVTVAICVRKITELTGDDMPTDLDEFNTFMQLKKKREVMH